jgi:hypothetical protein
VAACGWCGSAGVAGYALHGPALAVALAAAGAAAVTVVIVLLTAVICREDERSPFERLMLIACLLVGRRPADYLPPPERLRPITGSSPPRTRVRDGGGRSAGGSGSHGNPGVLFTEAC